MNREDAIEEFRSILNDFKAPYLVRLEESPLNKEEDIQDVDQINKVLSYFDRLYSIIKKVLLEKGSEQQNLVPEEKDIRLLLQKRGILRLLVIDPKLKEDFIYYLNLDLRTYPFTKSTRHLKKLEINNVESYQREIVPNLE